MRSKFKIILFGLGSIGIRHARLLRDNFRHELFAFRSRISPKDNSLGINEVYTWKEVEKIAPHIAFITNPTFLHIPTALRCAKSGMHLFIEKPIGSGYKGLDQLLNIVKKNRLSAYVAYCLRFHPVIIRLKEICKHNMPVHATVVCGSYLPKWRLSKDYWSCYSARKRSGGGVVFDLSHEFDYINYLFGEVSDMQGVYGKLSDLSIDSEDYADIIMCCPKTAVNLHLDYFSKTPQRWIKINFKSAEHAEGDLINNELRVYSEGRLRKFKYRFKRDDMYLKQLKYFFSNIGNPCMMNNLGEAAGLFKKIIGFKKTYA